MARIYVGTYAKYNDGNLSGEWLDPEDYSDYDEFIDACRELHKDEEDPELMFQDHEDCAGYVSESNVSPELWDWLGLDDDDREMVMVYRENEDYSADFDYIRDAYHGRYSDPEEFAEQLYEDLGEMPTGALASYIDWERVARDLGMDYTFIRHNGETWVFRPH